MAVVFLDTEKALWHYMAPWLVIQVVPIAIFN